jgi:hypothetical protein
MNFRANKRNFDSIHFLIAIAMLLAGCDINSPDAIVQTHVTTPVAVEREIGDFHTGAHVAGIVHLTVPQDLLSFEVGRVRYFLDSLDLNVGIVTNPPYSFTLDTRNYSQREHLLTIAVYEKKSTMGIYNFLHAPRLVCTTSAVFDQTPPSEAKNVTITYDGGILIQWDQTTTPSFRNYQIRTRFYSDYLMNTDVYDTIITERTTASWRINSSSHQFGTFVDIYVGVSNGIETAFTSSPATGIVGTSLPVQSPILKFWRHPTNNETYAWAEDKRIYVLSPDGLSILRTGPVLTDGSIYFNKDGSKLFLFNASARTITAYTTNDFTFLPPVIQLSGTSLLSPSVVVSPNGNIYVGNSDGTLWTIGELTGILKSSVPILCIGSTPRLAVSSDGLFLFSMDKPTGICKIDIRTDTPAVVCRTDLGSSDYIHTIGLTNDQNRLIVLHTGTSSVELLKTSDLSLSVSLPMIIAPCVGEYYGLANYAGSYVEDGTSLFLASSYRYIVQYNLTTNQRVKNWCVVNAPRSMETTRDGKSLLIGNIGTTIPNLIISR